MGLARWMDGWMMIRAQKIMKYRHRIITAMILSGLILISGSPNLVFHSLASSCSIKLWTVRTGMDSSGLLYIYRRATLTFVCSYCFVGLLFQAYYIIIYYIYLFILIYQVLLFGIGMCTHWSVNDLWYINR